jgi:hypothetical protein
LAAANEKEREKWENALRKAKKELVKANRHEWHPLTGSSSSKEDGASRNEAFDDILHEEEEMEIADNRTSENNFGVSGENCQNYIVNKTKRTELRNAIINTKRLKNNQC